MIINNDNTNTCGPNSLAKLLNKNLDMMALTKLKANRTIAQSYYKVPIINNYNTPEIVPENTNTLVVAPCTSGLKCNKFNNIGPINNPPPIPNTPDTIPTYIIIPFKVIILYQEYSLSSSLSSGDSWLLRRRPDK